MAWLAWAGNQIKNLISGQATAGTFSDFASVA